jgi:hypothetical protein
MLVFMAVVSAQRTWKITLENLAIAEVEPAGEFERKRRGMRFDLLEARMPPILRALF